MRRLCLFSIVSVLLCSVSFGQPVDLVVNQGQSSAMFTVSGASDSSSISGTGSIVVEPIAPPFNTAQLTMLDLTLVDGFDINFLGGLVSIEAAPGSVMLSIAMPGAAGLVDGANQFDQLGNSISLAGTVDIFDPLGLAGGSATFNLVDVGLVAVDFNDVQLSVDGQDLTVSADLDLNLDANGNAVQVNASIVATGQLPSILLGDVNQDGSVDLLDVQPFVDLLAKSGYQLEADMNQDGALNLLDVQLFVDALAGG